MGMSGYQMVWLVYLCSAALLLLVWFRLTKMLGNVWLKGVLRAFAVPLLLMPFSVGEGYDEQAPALLVLVMEALFVGTETISHVATPLLIVTLLSVFVTLLGQWLWFRWQRQREEERELLSHREQLLAEGEREAGELLR
jgi:hypothetical protein